jgi:hypothetical protein
MGVIEGAISRGQAVRSRGLDLYVDTVNGSNSNDGLSWEQAKATMAAALALATDHSSVYVVGDIREQINSPLGIQGVRIIGAAGGHVRHDDGVRWRTPASGAQATTPLFTIREQGWEVSGILFVPDANATVCLRLRRAEDATWPDGSHAIIKNCKFIGATVTGIGIEDHGGSSHDVIEDCEFFSLTTAIAQQTGAGIASPLRWQIRRNRFSECTNFIVLPGNECIVEENVLIQEASTANINTSGGTAGKNVVVNNIFPTAEASIANSNGYTGHASDSLWRNCSSNTAAMTVGIPGA